MSAQFEFKTASERNGKFRVACYITNEVVGSLNPRRGKSFSVLFSLPSVLRFPPNEEVLVFGTFTHRIV